MASTASTSRRGLTRSPTPSEPGPTDASDTRPIGVSRFAQEKPGVKWAGLFGAGGEEKKYGFEPEVWMTAE